MVALTIIIAGLLIVAIGSGFYCEQSCLRRRIVITERPSTSKPKSNKKYMFSNEDMDHITIDGVGGLHFDIDYFMKQPRFKEQIKHALECFEEEEGEEVT